MKVSLIGGLTGLLLLGSAQATNLDFGVAYQTTGTAFLERAWGRVGVSDLNLLGGRVSLGVSSRAADVGYARSLSLAPLGAASARTELAVTWQGGVRLSSRATGSVGPVALNLGGAYFAADASHFDPLAIWAFTPTDLRQKGWNADITARYRLSRTLVVVAGGEFGPQNQGFLGVEGRQELTRTVPPAPQDASDVSSAEGDDAAPAEPETESLGTLTWRAGARAGQDVLGVTGGVSYALPSGLNVGLDALIGPHDLGLTSILNAPDTLGEGSNLRLYAAYEPWRTASLPLRAGVEATMKAGPGELGFIVAGGRSAAGTAGFGVKLTYQLPLDDLLNP